MVPITFFRLFFTVISHKLVETNLQNLNVHFVLTGKEYSQSKTKDTLTELQLFQNFQCG